MSVLPVLFGYPVMLFPAHIAFLELIIDPACSTVFETISEDDVIMKRPPRKLTDPLFNTRVIIVGLIQGLSVAVLLFVLYLYLLQIGKDEVTIRTITFVSLVLSNLLLIIVNLTWSKATIKVLLAPNKLLWWVIGLAVVGMVFVVSIEPLLQVFHMTRMRPEDFFYLLLFVAVLSIWLECIKIVWAKMFRRQQTVRVD